MLARTQCRGASSTAFAYTPSSLELEWFPPHSQRGQPHAVGRVCEIARMQLTPRVDAWLRFANASIGDATREPDADERAALSSMRCDDGRVEYLEPLTGIARHPYAKCGCVPREKFSVNPTSLDYLVLQNLCRRAAETSHPPTLTLPAGRRAPRTLFFDLGSGTFSNGEPVQLGRGNGGGLGSKGGSGGPSIPLFAALYKRSCIEFDAIYAWEYSPFSPRRYWKDVPVEMRAKLHFFNVPVESEPHPNGVLALLREAATPDDFVVLKVDVDHSAIEESVVTGIAADPHLASLVDELFFEYHFYGEPHVEGRPFNPYWGVHNDTRHGPVPTSTVPAALRTNATADTALHLMHRLRRRGIRAHFWI